MPDQTTPAATAATTDATSNTTTTTAAAATTTPATGDEALGAAGIRALQAERDAKAAAISERDALKAEVEKLRTATMSDHDKAIAEAKKAGETEATQRTHGMVRRAEVRRALAAAGCSDVDIASLASEFGGLAVADDGAIADLDKTVTTFKAAHPTLFGAKGPGNFDTGLGGGRASTRTYTREQLRDGKFFADNRADILAAQREGRITG